MALTNLSQVTSSGIHTLSNYTTHNINSTGIITATEFSGNLSNSSGISTFAEIRVTGNLTVEGTTTTLDSNLTEVDRIEVGANSASPGIAVTQSGTGAAAYFNGGDVNIATGNLALASATPMVVASNGSGHLRLGAGGSEKVRITSAGLVGIGTITPTTALEIRTTTTNAATHYRNNASNGGAYFGVRATDLGAAAAGEAYVYSYNSGINLLADGNGHIDFATGGTASKVRITSAGNVGINDSNPTAKLSVVGNAYVSADSFTGENSGIFFSGWNDYGAGVYGRNSGNDLVMNAGSSEKLRIKSNGNIGIGTDNPQVQLHLTAADPYIRFQDTAAPTGHSQIMGTHQGALVLSADESDSVANSHLRFDVDGTERLRVDSEGKVLIGSNTGSVHGNRLLQIGKTNRSETYVSIVSSTSGESGLLFADTTTNDTGGYRGQIRYHHSDDSMNFRTGAAERLRITSTGNIGIGDVTPENALTIKNIGSFDGDANSFYLGSNFTGTGQNYTGSNKHAQRFFFNNAASNGYLKYENTGTTGTAGNAITWQERFRIRAQGPHFLLGTGGDATYNEITESSSNAGLVIGSSSMGNGGIVIRNSTSGTGRIYFADNSGSDPGRQRGQINYYHNGDYMMFATAGSERLRIDSVGSAQFTGQDSPSGRNTRISRYGSLLVATTGEILSNARCSIDSGNGNIATEGGVAAASVNLQSSSTNSWFQTGASYGGTNYVWAAKDSSANVWHSGLQTDGDLLIGGNITGTSRIGLYGSSGNIGLTNATTSAKLNVSTDIGGNYTGWKERNVASGSMSSTSIASKTPTINDFTYPNSSNGMLIWSTSKIGFAAGGESPQYGTGVQMLFDSGGLMLGGIRSFDRTSSTSTSTNWNIKLNAAGSAVFKGSLEADPILLDANDSWVKSTYGGISNSTVSSLNNLLIGQNMRGWVGTRDGGSATNNFYHITTHGGLGYCGTEYCYEGITKFYNNTGGSTANATFTPYERVRITSSRFYSSSGFHFSTNSSTNNSLPNPYNIGNVNSNNVAYPHTPGIYFVTASCQCDNTWRTLFTSINDSNWVIEGTSGDASSKRKYKIIGNPTSPSYGVNLVNTDYNDGGWNTGSISFRLDGTHPNWNLQVKCTSYYSTSNTSGIKFMLFVYY